MLQATDKITTETYGGCTLTLDNCLFWWVFLIADVVYVVLGADYQFVLLMLQYT